MRDGPEKAQSDLARSVRGRGAERRLPMV